MLIFLEKKGAYAINRKKIKRGRGRDTVNCTHTKNIRRKYRMRPHMFQHANVFFLRMQYPVTVQISYLVL